MGTGDGGVFGTGASAIDNIAGADSFFAKCDGHGVGCAYGFDSGICSGGVSAKIGVTNG